MMCLTTVNLVFLECLMVMVAKKWCDFVQRPSLRWHLILELLSNLLLDIFSCSRSCISQRLQILQGYSPLSSRKSTINSSSWVPVRAERQSGWSLFEKRRVTIALYYKSHWKSLENRYQAEKHSILLTWETPELSWLALTESSAFLQTIKPVI